ncbi:hypothetical protein [Allofournierella sp. CML151]|uniref:hypothetical protein n=1 Tax=Allofournierella sp. CML151 TaxID=2998082 RepID=UPI0022EA72FE|nr:hypothetical protein [Fournierella sp. CML151]
MPFTCDVFGVSPQMSDYSYYDRNELDTKLSRLLRRQTHIAIKGPSKCGKSWLRQKCLEDALIVQCRIGMNADDIYRQCLSSLHVAFNVQRQTQNQISGEISGNAELKVPLLGNANTGLAGSYMRNSSIDTGIDYQTSVENLEFIAQSINQSGKKMVIEDFHYLGKEARRKLSYDLKTLWDYGCFVIIIGVWTQTNLLTSMNPDLTGRIEELEVSWSDNDLERVIEKGCNALNIRIDSKIVEDMIQDSFGNIGILQSLLLKLVEEQANIEKTQTYCSIITDPCFYVNAAKSYANQLDGLYQQFAKTLSAGIRQRKNSTGIYALVMEAVVNATDDELIHGFSRNKIYEITNGKEPRIQKGNLKTVLIKLADLQEAGSRLSLVISYDESIDAVFAVDLQLLFYRKHHTMRWPWEELAEEARKLSQFEEETEEG